MEYFLSKTSLTSWKVWQSLKGRNWILFYTSINRECLSPDGLVISSVDRRQEIPAWRRTSVSSFWSRQVKIIEILFIPYSMNFISGEWGKCIIRKKVPFGSIFASRPDSQGFVSERIFIQFSIFFMLTSSINQYN